MLLVKKRRQPARTNQSGFTLVELMIASMVFSVVILLVAATVVRFTTSYQKGLIESTTQNTARSILDTLSQRLQFSSSDPSMIVDSATGSEVGRCIDSTRYEYVLGQQLEDDPTEPDQVTEALVEERGTGFACRPEIPGITHQEMLQQHMRLSNLEFSNAGLPAGMWRITVKVAYGDNDLFEDGTATSKDPVCKADRGSQWCAVRELSTTVQRRL